MKIADVEISQELVYRGRYMQREYGPRIRVTEIQRAGEKEAPTSYRDATGQVRTILRDRIIGIVLDSMGQPWPVGSQFLGLALDFDMPKDTPKGG